MFIEILLAYRIIHDHNGRISIIKDVDRMFIFVYFLHYSARKHLVIFFLYKNILENFESEIFIGFWPVLESEIFLIFYRRVKWPKIFLNCKKMPEKSPQIAVKNTNLGLKSKNILKN